MVGELRDDHAPVGVPAEHDGRADSIDPRAYVVRVAPQVAQLRRVVPDTRQPLDRLGFDSTPPQRLAHRLPHPGPRPTAVNQQQLRLSHAAPSVLRGGVRRRP